MSKINRRDFIKLSSAATALASCPTILKAQSNLPAIARVAVIGGGFAGATVAKYLRLWSNQLVDVTLIDKHPHHVSCILSNLVLNDRLKLSDITQQYNILESDYGIQLLQGTVTNVQDNGAIKTLQLNNQQTHDFEFIVVAPGIEFIDIPGLKQGSDNEFQHVPHAWIAGAQTQLLRDQLHTELPIDGTFVMTVPQSPYRCPPGPYERACVVADFIKRKKGKGKVIVLDPHANITVEKDTFGGAFKGIYKNIVDYHPNTPLLEVDAVNRTAITPQGNFQGDVLNVIPTHRAADIVLNLGLANGRWASVDPVSYESSLRPSFYVLGDANDSGQPKSGHMANSQAKVCADAILKTIADSSKAEVFAPERLENITTNSACYSPITYDQASWLTAVFQYDSTNNIMQLVADSFAHSKSPHWSRENFDKMLDWADSLFSNTFR